MSTKPDIEQRVSNVERQLSKIEQHLTTESHPPSKPSSAQSVSKHLVNLVSIADDEEKGADHRAVLEAAEKIGFSPADVEDEIETMVRRGEIYEVGDNRLRIVR